MTQSPSDGQPIHVVFLLHGLWGNPSQMFTLQQRLKVRALESQANVHVHCCNSYEKSKSFDGVDICTDRVLKEIRRVIRGLEEKERTAVTKFSILGYSLGGLIARVVVKRLADARFFDHISPCNFTTFACPAIGIPILPGTLSHVVQGVSAFFLSRSGSHLYLRDKQESKQPLVYDLATKEFTDAVAQFAQIDVYANCVADGLVPYMTGAMKESDPFLPALTRARKENPKAVGNTLFLDNLKLTFDPKYPAILTDVCLSDEPTIPVSTGSDSELVFKGELKPTTYRKIRPWLVHTTYRFMPSPLDYVLVATIPFVVPAIPLALGAFTYQRIASALRIRQHLKDTQKAVLPPPHPVDSQNCLLDGDTGAHGKSVQSDRTALSSDSDSDHSSVGDQLDTITGGLESNQTSQVGHGANVMDILSGTAISTDLSGITVADKGSPQLERLQREIASMIRTALPRMRTHLVFIPNVWNSHASIMCQNSAIPEHMFGISAVQHWADHFML